MTSSASDDLTSKRIDAKWRAFLTELDGVYQRCRAPKPTFWATYDAEEAAVVAKLKRRPIPLLDVENLFAVFRSKIMKAL